MILTKDADQNSVGVLGNTAFPMFCIIGLRGSAAVRIHAEDTVARLVEMEGGSDAATARLAAIGSAFASVVTVASVTMPHHAPLRLATIPPSIALSPLTLFLFPFLALLLQ